MRKKKVNIYDNLVEKLAQNFQNVENFHLIYEDESSKNLFEFYLKKHSELLIFKQLFTSKYIPATNQVIANELKALSKSKYKKLLINGENEIRENLSELLRLAYVGLFHKYENFVDKLIDVSLEVHSEEFSDRKDFEKFFIETLDFKIKDWKNIKTIRRLNWIAICVKHYDGFPHKKDEKEINKGIPSEFLSHPQNEKLKLSTKQFKLDCDSILKFYELLYQMIVQAGSLKSLVTVDPKTEDLLGREFVESQKIKTEQVISKIKTYLNLLKLL